MCSVSLFIWSEVDEKGKKPKRLLLPLSTVFSIIHFCLHPPPLHLFLSMVACHRYIHRKRKRILDLATCHLIVLHECDRIDTKHTEQNHLSLSQQSNHRTTHSPTDSTITINKFIRPIVLVVFHLYLPFFF
jgi:hypothetical protein